MNYLFDLDMIKKYNVLYISFFFLVIVLPSITMFLHEEKKTVGNRENRKMAAFPQLDIKRLDPFPKEFDNYYNDNFTFRNELLQINSFLKFFLFKESPNKHVILGGDYWLYTRKYLNSFTSERLLNEREISELRDLYTSRSKWLNEKGIKNYIFIIPTKYNVYSEFLPSTVTKQNKVSIKEQFIDATNGIKNLTVVDLLQYIEQHKLESAIRQFHKTDQHWNEYGAFIGYKCIVDNINKSFRKVKNINESDFIVDSIEVSGKSLARTILLEEKLNELDIRVRKTVKRAKKVKPEILYESHDKFPYKSQFQIHYAVDDDSLPSVLILRDSYTNSLLHLVPESFKKTIFIWDNWCYRLNKTIVEQEKPDIFITLLIESNIPYLLHGHPSER